LYSGDSTAIRATLHHPWLRFALRRTLTLIVSLWVLATATFLLVQLVPGDPATAGLGPGAPPGQIEARRAALHLDQPLLSQYRQFLTGAVHGDFGESFTTREPVSTIIHDRFPQTAKLAFTAFFVALLGVPIGLSIAIFTRGGKHRITADSFSVASGTLYSIPDFLIATGLIALFAVGLGWFPVAGSGSVSAYVLPVAALAAAPAAGLARLARAEGTKALEQEYMRVARGKRLPRRLLYFRHLAPNAVTATLTVSGLLLGGIIAGTVIVENVFAWPGIGSALTQAIIDKDYPLVQGIVLLMGGIALVANTVVDIVLGLLDPRSLIRES
jgi:peptide/nickel transport system permease protein